MCPTIPFLISIPIHIPIPITMHSCWKFWHSNPHRSPYGTGNYDVNVIMSAVQSKRVQWATGLQLEAAWFDKRKCK